MGEMVNFPANGSTAGGYLAVADGGGPGVIVIQEWWGLVPHIKEVCDRFAAEGFTALAPDLFGGRSTTEPDEAGKYMMSLNLDHAAAELSGAVDFLLAHDEVTGDGVGVVGFCMGGGLALVLACRRPDAVRACAPFYGVIPWPDAQPDWSALACPVRGHYAGNDGFFGPEMVAELEGKLRDLGKDVVLTVHPGVEHAFANDHRPEVYDAVNATLALGATYEFLRSTLV